MELRQIADFRAEVAELAELLGGLDAADWARETGFKRWTVNDIIQHLHMSDMIAHTAATDAAGFEVLAADIKARRASGVSWVAETRERLGGLEGAALLARWTERAGALCDALAAMDPAARLPWFGPGMGVRMFVTARQMETWAHGQAIWDVMGKERPAPSSRLRNIAEIGVRTFGWTFQNRGMEPPGPVPTVRLATPFGEEWEWPGGADIVSGDAMAFCQVVTQTRNIADTGLVVQGEVARRWMALAQCFAGNPENPPAPGMRARAK